MNMIYFSNNLNKKMTTFNKRVLWRTPERHLKEG